MKNFQFQQIQLELSWFGFHTWMEIRNSQFQVQFLKQHSDISFPFWKSDLVPVQLLLRRTGISTSWVAAQHWYIPMHDTLTCCLLALSYRGIVGTPSFWAGIGATDPKGGWMDKFRCQFQKKSWVIRAQYLNFFSSLKGFFKHVEF